MVVDEPPTLETTPVDLPPEIIALLAAFATIGLRPRLGQGPAAGRWGHSGQRATHRLFHPADHGPEPGTPLHQLPPRPQPRRLVLPGRRTGPARPDRRCHPPRLAHRPGRR